jgi:hypothetical protein
VRRACRHSLLLHTCTTPWCVYRPPGESTEALDLFELAKPAAAMAINANSSAEEIDRADKVKSLAAVQVQFQGGRPLDTSTSPPAVSRSASRRRTRSERSWYCYAAACPASDAHRCACPQELEYYFPAKENFKLRVCVEVRSKRSLPSAV